MLRYLCFQRQKYGEDGRERYVQAIVKTKPRKYGEVVDTQIVSRKTPTLITGAHDSGKSQMLARLYAEERAIWGRKITAPALWLGALRPLAAWSDVEHVSRWWNDRAANLQEKVDAGDTSIRPEDLRPWSKVRAWERSEALADYVQETGAVLFLDDCHKLAGRKLQIARQCTLAARIWVAGTSDEQQIPPNLRSVMMRRDPQMIRLGSDVAYDATDLLTWLFALILLAAGAWEASAVVAGLRMVSKGGRSARQNA